MSSASSPLLEGLQQKLHELDAQHLIRQRRIVSTPHAPSMTVDGRTMLAFCSNDYLGLAADPRIIEALQQGAAIYGGGSGASHFITRPFPAYAAMGDKLAPFQSPFRPIVRSPYF